MKKETSPNLYLSTNFSNKMKRNYETSMTGDDHESQNNKSRKRTENDDTVENLKEMEEVNNLIQMESHGSNSKNQNNRYDTV